MWFRSFITCALFACIAFPVDAQSGFVENRGQWNDAVLFRSDISSGAVFFCDNKITYSFYDSDQLEHFHNTALESDDEAPGFMTIDRKVNCFAYSIEFVGADKSGIAGTQPATYRNNYFLGNDSTRWESNVPVYEQLNYSSVYPGIDVVYMYSEGQLKNNFLVAAGVDPSQIRMQYTAARNLAIVDGALQIDAGFMTISEIIPMAYQEIGGKEYPVACSYRLNNDLVTFEFPEGYDSSFPLVIDPVLIASTYSGGTCISAGYCSTYDEEGNIYSGGDCIAIGYPATLGAFDVSYNGGWDMAISKYNPTATALLYCTYIGGTTDESPISLFVHQGNLYIYGNSNSSDFPVTANAFDQSFNGQHDIVLLELSNNGSALLASTYVGGASTDGVSAITYNPGDGYRGEIIVDNNGDVFVAGSSASQGFPVTAGAYCTTNSGAHDAVVFKMNGSLSTIIWATFLGGSIHDAALSIRIDNSGFVYVCGATRGIFLDFPIVPGCYQTTYLGGATDAFVAKFDPSGSNLVACSFLGGTGVDNAYFIDLDRDGNVYVIGLAKQGTSVTAGVYSNPGSQNFIVELNSTLTSMVFSTVIGDGTVNTPVMPTAFMVDECNRIFIAGFGGGTGWPTSVDAMYTWADSTSEFYLAVLDAGASSMLYATFFPGWHVDGGTSRFDPNGILYQTVCQGGFLFPTTSGAYSDGSNAPMWDICVFKMDFQMEQDSVVLPNIFTPNRDGLNDLYDVGLTSVEMFDLHIYDRWGNEVFTSSDSSVMWDGTHNGHDCPDGVYYVLLEHSYCSDERYSTTGFVHLIRNPD